MENLKIVWGAVLVLSAVGFVSKPVLAQTQTQMNQTAARNAGKADAALNAAYQRLIAKLDANGKVKLKKAQQAWLVFRKADAEALASPETGGSMYPMVYENYVAQITVTRTSELRKALEDSSL